MVQNDGTKPVSRVLLARVAVFDIDSNPYTFLAQWIWVRRPPAEPIDQPRQERSEQEAVEEASLIRS